MLNIYKIKESRWFARAFHFLILLVELTVLPIAASLRTPPHFLPFERQARASGFSPSSFVCTQSQNCADIFVDSGFG